MKRYFCAGKFLFHPEFHFLCKAEASINLIMKSTVSADGVAERHCAEGAVLMMVRKVEYGALTAQLPLLRECCGATGLRRRICAGWTRRR